MHDGTLFKLSAFPRDGRGGNPAGVWLGAALPDGASMQAIAREVGFSETAFVAPATGDARDIRYYSPEAEVSFCGHATIAAGVVLGRTSGAGRYRLATAVGEVPLTVRRNGTGFDASLTSVAPTFELAGEELLADALRALQWRRDELDPAIPAALAYAGAWHLVIAVATAERLAELDYDFAALKSLMRDAGLTTLQLVWRECRDLFHARNPFPVGGVVEDPATGAAAAALGGYLRDAGLMAAPAKFVVHQGTAMQQPSLLEVEVPVQGGITVTGSAVDID